MSRLPVVVLALGFTCSVLAQAPRSDERGATFPVKGARIYYHVLGSGDGAPLVVVNGGPGFDHNYLHASTAWNRLAKDRRVVFYDQRGNGRSSADKDAAMDLAAQVDDLEALRASLKAERIDLLGHSWGGYLVMAYSALHPDRIRHLIVVGSAAPKWSDTLFLFDSVFPETTEAQRVALAEQRLGNQEAEDRDIRLYFTMLFYSPDKRDAFVAHSSDYHYSREINAAINRDLARFDLTPELSKFTFPTLVMTGRFDMNVAPLTAYRIHQTIGGSKFVVFDRSGHLPFYEEPEAFVREVNRFLDAR